MVKKKQGQGQPDEDKGLNMQRKPSEDKGPETRCNPGCVSSVAKHLPPEAIQRIKELGFSKLLDLQLDALGSRKICGLLMEKAIVHAESNQIELRIRDGVSLWITQEVVQHVLDMPIGSAKELPSSEAAEEEYNRMYKALKCVTKKYKVKKPAHAAPAANQEQDNEDGEGHGGDMEARGEGHDNSEHNDEVEADDEVEAEEMYAEDKRNIFSVNNIELLVTHSRDEDVSKHIDTDMLVKLFFGVVLERMLLPATSVYVSAATLEAVQDLEQLRDIDWSYLVYERLKKACYEFAKKPSQMNGCVAVLMVVFVDCIEGNYLKMEESCRINLYTDRMLKHHVQEEPIEQINGNKKRKRQVKRKWGPRKLKSLENINLMRWEDSCYRKFAVVREHDRLENSDGQKSSGNKSNLDDRIDPDSVYKKHVLERTRDGIVLDFDYCCVAESTFVDCFKPRGLMQSNILHLVCHLWSMDWNDKIILGEFAVKDLLNQGKETTYLDMELTAEKVKGVTQIFIPVVSSGHWSLVVVSTTPKKIYILDSCPGRHKKVADDLLTKLQTYLRSKHNTDISGYDVETPEVQRQSNNCDCGFHVLLYIQGFEEMEISNINREKVLMFRKQLSMYLLYHRMNRKDPAHRAVDEVTVDVDEDKEEDECFVSPQNFRRDDYQDKPQEKKDDPPSAHGNGEDDLKNCSKYPENNSSGDGKNELNVPSADSKKDTSGRLETQDAEKSDKGASGSNQEDSPVDGGTGVQTTPASLLDDYHDDDCPPHSSTANTPTVRLGKRRNAPNSKYGSFMNFEERKFLSHKKSAEIYQLIKADCNDLLVLNVGGTTMTGGELVKCLEEGDSALSIINAFVQCLKYDDQNKGYNKERIIIPPQDLTGEGVVQGIVKELSDEEAKHKKGKEITQRFLACPILHHEEWFVFFVDIKAKGQISVLHSNDSKLISDQINNSGKTFGEQVDKAFVQCGYISPFSDMSKIRVSAVVFNAKSKDSALASMLSLEQYNGNQMPAIMKNPDSVKEYKASKLVHLLLHEKNTADLPLQINEILQEKHREKKQSSGDETRVNAPLRRSTVTRNVKILPGAKEKKQLEKNEPKKRRTKGTGQP